MLIAARMNWNFAFVETGKKYSIQSLQTVCKKCHRLLTFVIFRDKRVN